MILSSYVLLPYKLHVIDTYCLHDILVYGSGLRRKSYGTKRIFTQFQASLYIFLEGAIFVVDLFIHQNNSSFPKISAVFESETDEVNKFA